jgi:hypothetical protein
MEREFFPTTHRKGKMHEYRYEGKTCEEILADASIVVVNGGPVARDRDLIERQKLGHEFVMDHEGIRFFGLPSYMNFANAIRQEKGSYQNYMLEMVFDETVEYLSTRAKNCNILRISNADLTAASLESLSRFPQLQFVHISLYHGSSGDQDEGDFDVGHIHNFCRRSIGNKNFSKFELFGRFILRQEQQMSLFSIRKKMDIFVYLYTHQSCRWWPMDLVLDQDIAVDGIAVYRHASEVLKLDHDFVARVQKSAKQSDATTETSGTETNTATAADEEDFESCDKCADELELPPAAAAGNVEQRAAQPARAKSILRREPKSRKDRRVSFAGTDQIKLLEEPASQQLGQPVKLRMLQTDENGNPILDEDDEDAAAAAAAAGGQPADHVPDDTSDADHMPPGFGIAIDFDPEEPTPGNRIITNYSIIPQRTPSLMRRLWHRIKGMKCTCWNNPATTGDGSDDEQDGKSGSSSHS